MQNSILKDFKKRSIILCLIVLPFLNTTAKVFAQRADYSGVWTLEERKSLTGPDYANGIPLKISIIQTPDSINIEKISFNQYQVEVKTNETIGIDGNLFETKVSNNKKTITIEWIDDNQNFIETTSYTSENKKEPNRITIYNWSLSKDKKILYL